MGAVTYFPRGYTSAINGTITESVESTGDGQLDSLYKLYVSRAVNTQSWEFRKRVIALGSELFGNLLEWYVYQATQNQRIYGLNYKFLEDTLLFIKTGKRDMSVLTWYELLLESPNSINNVANMHRLTSLGLLNDKDWFGESGISRWLTHQNGFDDFIMTLNILFGNPKSTIIRIK